jgi:hypothetical protein
VGAAATTSWIWALTAASPPSAITTPPGAPPAPVTTGSSAGRTDDFLFGVTSADRVVTAAGNDTLVGRGGNDTLFADNVNFAGSASVGRWG